MRNDEKPPHRPRIAVVGCGHGGLDTIYADLAIQCEARSWSISDLDLLIVCGDFQAVRNSRDLNCMSVPQRYRHLGDFHKYYSGQSHAPVLTIVIGGNHEASNYFFELYHGGWLAPNIYYLGAAGVVRYRPLRIARISGIYDQRDYRKPHHERLPYDRDDIRSVYHVREYDVRKLLAISGNVNVMLSHDWPAWVEISGDAEGLYKSNPRFYESAKRDRLGSKAATQLLDHLRPSYWFSGHMNVKFEAAVQHAQRGIRETIRAQQVADELRSELPVFKRKYTSLLTSVSSTVETGDDQTTNFLALGKVGQDRDTYLGLLEVDIPDRSYETKDCERTPEGRYHLSYDEEWLAITRAYNDSLLLADPKTLIVPPNSDRHTSKQISPETIARHKQRVREKITAKGLLKIPMDFVPHAPFQSDDMIGTKEQPAEYPNMQTKHFAKLLGLENSFEVLTK